MNRILFIDDDVLALQLMSRATVMLGHQPILSTSAELGLSMVAHEKPALILVDLQMDGMDGTEFVRQLRRLPGVDHLPVVIFAASACQTDEENARQAGANGFLHKPIGLEQLDQTIQAYTA